MTSKTSMISIAVTFVVGAAAWAQSPQALNLFGKVLAIDSKTISIVADNGSEKTLPLAENIAVFQSKAATINDIQPNDFVASAAEPQPDGTLHSTELRIFPEKLRGVGEGQRPMNDARNQTMTNATVVGPAATLGGDRIRVRFPTGEAILVISKDIPVTRIEDAQASDIKIGARIRLQGANDTSVNRITIQ